MKRLVIVEHRAHELANQLWSDLAIHAFGFEIGARVINLTWLEHGVFRWAYLPFARLIDALTRSSAYWALGVPKLLPPTKTLPEKFKDAHTLWFFGWMFKNPEGFTRHREKLLAAVGLRSRRALAGKRLVGVHLKLQPFRGFEDGEFLIPVERVSEIVREYLKERDLRAEDVALIIVSDRTPPYDVLRDLESLVYLGNTRENLELLAGCEVIIGTNSTYSNLAAWIGDVPHIVTTSAPVDWPYYKDKHLYFENKYATFAL